MVTIRNWTAWRREPWRIAYTERAMVVLLQMRMAVMRATRRMFMISRRLGQVGLLRRAAHRPMRRPAKVMASETRNSHIMSLPQLTSQGERPPAHREARA